MADLQSDLEHEFTMIREAMKRSPEHGAAILQAVRLAVSAIKRLGREHNVPSHRRQAGVHDLSAEWSRRARAEFLDGR